MNIRLLDYLVCPIDLSPLELIEWESRNIALTVDYQSIIRRMGLAIEKFGRDIRTGVLINRNRKILYPIIEGVPRMLVYPTDLTSGFIDSYDKQLKRNLPDYNLPNESPAPGEKEVLRTFSSEWVDYKWHPNSYWKQTPENLYRSVDYLLDFAHKPVKNRSVLEIGIGIGGIADHVVRSQECELFGIDLSYAVDIASKQFGKNPLLHILQASIFNLPFPSNTFDLVFSQGVLHHTFSTKAAFDCISLLPKSGGRLYVWVYNPEAEKRNLQRRVLMIIEKVLRPIISRLPNSAQTLILTPIVPLYIRNQRLRVSRQDYGYIQYGWREAIHAARDRLTPLYAHRHSEAEVKTWFELAGYSDIRCLGQRKIPSFMQENLVSHTGVDGNRL